MSFLDSSLLYLLSHTHKHTQARTHAHAHTHTHTHTHISFNIRLDHYYLTIYYGNLALIPLTATTRFSTNLHIRPWSTLGVKYKTHLTRLSDFSDNERACLPSNYGLLAALGTTAISLTFVPLNIHLYIYLLCVFL